MGDLDAPAQNRDGPALALPGASRAAAAAAAAAQAVTLWQAGSALGLGPGAAVYSLGSSCLSSSALPSDAAEAAAAGRPGRLRAAGPGGCCGAEAAPAGLPA